VQREDKNEDSFTKIIRIKRSKLRFTVRCKILLLIIYYKIDLNMLYSKCFVNVLYPNTSLNNETKYKLVEMGLNRRT